MHGETFVAAAIQAAPVFLDLDGTLDRVESLATEAARRGASLVVFPEAFVSGFPYWIWSTVSSAEQDGFGQLWDSAIDIPGPAVDRIGEIATSTGTVIVIGANERDSEHGRSTLYNSMLTFDRDGRLVRRHRKLVPTYKERTIWGAGDGSGLSVADTDIGPVGGLICWENYMPLARFHQYAQGIQVYVTVTVDERPDWIDLMRTIASEARIYVVSSCQYLEQEVIDTNPLLVGFPGPPTPPLGGTSVIVNPSGEVIAGPQAGNDVILTAEIDPSKVVEGKHSLDVTGHYSRPDIFQLTIDTQPRTPFTTK